MKILMKINYILWKTTLKEIVNFLFLLKPSLNANGNEDYHSLRLF